MSTIAEVTGSYNVATASASSVTVSWGAGRLAANTGNLLLAFTNTVFASSAGNPVQTISGWTQVTFTTNYTFSGASRCALFYKFATSGDTGSVTFTPSLVTYTVASATGNGTTQTYTTSGTGTTQVFVTGQLVTVTGLSPSGYNVTNATITAVGGSSGAWTFSVAGSTTGASSGSGTVTYSSVNRAAMMLMEFSGVNATTPLDQGAISATTNGTTQTALTVLSSGTSHVNGGALGIVFTGMTQLIGGSVAAYAINPPTVLANTQKFFNAAVSLIAGYSSFNDTNVTDTSTNIYTLWTTGRPASSIYIALRPSTYQQTGQSIDGTEVIADTQSPTSVDSQTAGTVVASETITDSIDPTSTDSQTGATIVASEATTNSTETTTDSQTGATVTAAETVTDTSAPTSTDTQTSGSIDGTEVVADTAAPTSTDSQTAASIVAAEAVASVSGPTSTDSQSGAAVTAVAADTNNGQTIADLLSANTVTMTWTPKINDVVKKASVGSQTTALSAAATNAASQYASQATGQTVAESSSVSSSDRNGSSTVLGQQINAMMSASGSVATVLRAVGQTLGVSVEALGSGKGIVTTTAAPISSAVLVKNFATTLKTRGVPGTVKAVTVADSVVLGCVGQSVELSVLPI